MQRTPSRYQIRIVPVGVITPAITEFLALTLPSTLKINCWVDAQRRDTTHAYDAIRQQYHSTRLLADLTQLDGDDHTKILGVTNVDLFIPILTFVFGEAQVNGRAALISMHRLHQGFYGLPTDERLFYDRCEKESLHELGHAFGLLHCHQFDCVMHFSNSIEQVDLKSNGFCGECRTVFEEAPR